MKTNLRAGSQSATTFTRFMRSLGADRASRTLLGILIALVFLVAWIAWLFLARVTVYEITESARIESEGAGYTVESAVAGRVVSTRLKLGRVVSTRLKLGREVNARLGPARRGDHVEGGRGRGRGR